MSITCLPLPDDVLALITMYARPRLSDDMKDEIGSAHQMMVNRQKEEMARIMYTTYRGIIPCRHCGNYGLYQNIRDDYDNDEPDYDYGTCGDCDPIY